jgi:hypothetical protein
LAACTLQVIELLAVMEAPSEAQFSQRRRTQLCVTLRGFSWRVTQRNTTAYQSGFHLMQNYKELISKLTSFRTALNIPIVTKPDVLTAVALNITIVCNGIQ